MVFSFENMGTNTYLVYEMKESDELDTMSLGMLTNNSIPGIAQTAFTQMDTTKYIKYNVSAKVSVKQLFEGPVNKKRLIGVFSGVVDAMISAEDYMIDPNTLLLDAEYIFADVSTCETELICLPVLNPQHKNQSVELFFKNILFTTQFDQTENCDHVALLINYLNGNPGVSLTDFKALLDNMSSAEPVQKPVSQKPANTESTKPAARAEQQPSVQPFVQPTVPQNKPVEQKPLSTVTVPPTKAELPKVQKQDTNEKPMSFFYLMQHYNKENAAIYKAQQEAAKAKKAKSVATPPAKGTISSGFPVPGHSGEVMAVPNQKSAQVTVPSESVEREPQRPVEKAPQPEPKPSVQGGAPLNFGETTVLGKPVGETTVLNGAAPQSNRMDPHLIRAKNNEKIPLNKPVFRIGKERSYVDYFIGDNTAISRSHANIVNHNGEFFVVDTNSTNHTYVNGGMIPSNEETKLSHGAKIRLANEDFEFKLY